MKHAARCAILCRNSYDGLHLDPRMITVNGVSERAIILPELDRVFVAFRGTESGAQWMDNFNGHKVSTPYGLVHYGFLNALTNILSETMQRVLSFGVPVVVTGHSRGAAFAQYFAVHLDQHGAVVEEVQLFGAPRMFGKLAAAGYDERLKAITFRWRHNNDPVCGVPPRWMGYRSVGRRNYITSTGKVLLDDARDRHLDRLWGRIKGALRGRLFDGRYDHDIRHYTTATMQAAIDRMDG